MTRGLLRCCALLRRYLDDAVSGGLVDQQGALPRRARVAQNAGVDVAGLDRPALERFRGDIETDQHIGTHTGLVVPDGAVEHRDAIGMRARAGRRVPLGDLSRLWIDPANPADA